LWQDIGYHQGGLDQNTQQAAAVFRECSGNEDEIGSVIHYGFFKKEFALFSIYTIIVKIFSP